MPQPKLACKRVRSCMPTIPPQAVQPHMGKCFDGIRRLDFGDDPKSIDIFAMISGEGERVSLGKNLKARGNVEKWLCEVESSMISGYHSLRSLCMPVA